jgi:hypothetical protein
MSPDGGFSALLHQRGLIARAQSTNDVMVRCPLAEPHALAAWVLFGCHGTDYGLGRIPDQRTEDLEIREWTCQYTLALDPALRPPPLRLQADQHINSLCVTIGF